MCQLIFGRDLSTETINSMHLLLCSNIKQPMNFFTSIKTNKFVCS